MGVSMGIPSRSRDLLTTFTHLCATCSASQASAFSSYSSSSSISSACAFYSTCACCQALDRGATLDRFAPCSWLSRTQIVPNIHEREMLGMSHSFATDAKKAKKRQKVAGATEINAGEGRSDGDKFSERDAALQSAISHITSQFGKESVLWLGRNTDLKNVPVISSGSLTLDVALGVGGLPKGRVVEIYGPEASGKTTLALHVIAEAQKLGGYCVFIDAEHALDASLAEAIGVRTENLLVAQPDCGEQALAVTDTFVRSGSVDVIVVDSVAALVPRTELEGEMGDSHMAVLARLMSQALRKLTHSLSRSQTILIFINQIRQKLATFGGFGGAPVEVTSGGNALKFYASVRLNIRRTNLLKRGEETFGSQVIVKIAKNKLAPPFKTAEFELEFGKGISKEAEVLDLSVKYGFLQKSGNWYVYSGENIANGKENAKKYLREHEELFNALTVSLKDLLMVHSSSSEETDAQELLKVDADEKNQEEDGQMEMSRTVPM
ncbi:hypothetical protein O6H91_15G006600 [Diphasiastrum complanatum]|uniref:Uncharacterized protein n=1 Tax=Diphasiastrum complanatum TaxID=34168 RepID=A0ACC2BFN4_DIPCM|nr:hypothetical protein O6H91_15G006600 [Diphasiastrum complanatum]